MIREAGISHDRTGTRLQRLLAVSAIGFVLVGLAGCEFPDGGHQDQPIVRHRQSVSKRVPAAEATPTARTTSRAHAAPSMTAAAPSSSSFPTVSASVRPEKPATQPQPSQRPSFERITPPQGRPCVMPETVHRPSDDRTGEPTLAACDTSQQSQPRIPTAPLQRHMDGGPLPRN